MLAYIANIHVYMLVRFACCKYARVVVATPTCIDFYKTFMLSAMTQVRVFPTTIKSSLISNGQYLFYTAYSVVLEKSLRSDEWMKHLDPYIELENKARNDFANPKKKWREGNTKTSFTYLLLDPRLTANLPARANKQSLAVTWNTFISSIFYVGKGKRSTLNTVTLKI